MLEQKRNNSLLSWQTRLICSYIAAANPPMDGVDNHLLDAAAKITLEPDSISEEKSDDISSERPVKYASDHAMSQFARGLAGGPMQAW